MRIAIFTQLEWRDRLLDERIGSHLRNWGHEVAIANFVFYGRKFVLEGKPNVIVIPEARCEHTIDFVEAINEMGIVIVVRRTEPGYSREGYEKADETHRPTVMGHWPYAVDLEIVWSEEFAEVVRESPLSLTKNVKAAGAFTFDHYFPLPKRKSSSKTVLFASCWDYSTRDPEYCIPEMPFGDPSHLIAYEKCRAGKDKWLAEIERVCRLWPDWEVILKLHPGEDREEYIETFGDTIEIIHDDFAFKVLPRADVLIHAGSTMAVEAHLMGIPAFRFCNFVEDDLILDVSPEIQEVNLDKVKLGKSNANTKVIQKLEKTFFGTIDGKACLRAAQLINELEPKEDKDIPQEWPESKRDYSAFGVYKDIEFGDAHRDILQCCCCKRVVYLLPTVEFAKCPYCAIMLTRESKRKKDERKVRRSSKELAPTV